MMRISIAHPFRKQIYSTEANWKEDILQAIGERFQSLSSRHPKVYFLAVYGIAFLGYAYLLLFPILVLVSSVAIIESLISDQSLAIDRLMIQALVLVISALITYKIIRFKPTLPKRNVLSTKKPGLMLCQLVDDYVRHYRSVKINRIIITSDFGIEIARNPRWAMPIWSTTTLYIGLPMIQCFSVTRFQCALARRVGQFAKSRKWRGNLLYQLRDIWPLYSDNSNQSSFGYQPIRWFFSVYAPIYRIISAPAARTDELAADTCAMELFNDEDVLDWITVQMACHRYVEDECLPAMQKMQATHTMTAEGIAAGTVSLVCKLIHSDRMVHWVTKAGSAETRLDDTLPSLSERAQNIGHTQARMRITEPESAASVYLSSVNNRNESQ
jgi:hypothetical protein